MRRIIVFCENACVYNAFYNREKCLPESCCHGMLFQKGCFTEQIQEWRIYGHNRESILFYPTDLHVGSVFQAGPGIRGYI